MENNFYSAVWMLRFGSTKLLYILTILDDVMNGITKVTSFENFLKKTETFAAYSAAFDRCNIIHFDSAELEQNCYGMLTIFSMMQTQLTHRMENARDRLLMKFMEKLMRQRERLLVQKQLG